MKSFNCKSFNLCHLTKNRVKYLINYKDDKCVFCNIEKETNIHLFYDCSIIKDLLLNFINIFNKFNIIINLESYSWICSIFSKPFVKLKTILSDTIKWSIWKERNNLVFNKTIFNFNQFIFIIKSNLK